MGPEEGERDGGGIGREGKDVYAESSSARRAPFIGAWMYDDDMLPAYMRDNGSHTLTCMLCQLERLVVSRGFAAAKSSGPGVTMFTPERAMVIWRRAIRFFSFLRFFCSASVLHTTSSRQLL